MTLADLIDAIERDAYDGLSTTAEFAEAHNMAEELEAENAKLRELAHLVAEYTSADQCEGCVTKRACNAGELDICWIRKAILEKLCEIGVEVDG